MTARGHVGTGALTRPAEQSSAGWLVGFLKTEARFRSSMDKTQASCARPHGRDARAHIAVCGRNTFLPIGV